MRFHETLYFLISFLATIHALALPASWDSALESGRDLFKRKGGGGGGGRGGGGSSSSSSSSSSSGSSSGSSGGSRGSGSSGSPYSSSAGSGAPRSYGGGYYGGGASTPYRAGDPRSGSTSRYLPVAAGAGLGLAIFPGLWLYGAYAYSYPGYYHYHNNTANRNESHPVECLCAQYNPCGCDVKNETGYLNDVANNNTISRMSNVNGTDTLVINGTLPNGTTAPGGSDSAAPSLRQGLVEGSGLWVIVAGVAYTMWFM